jgi:hypothetical protein
MPPDLAATFEIVRLIPPPHDRMEFVVKSLQTTDRSATNLRLSATPDVEALVYRLDTHDVCYPKGRYLYTGTATSLELR